MTKADATKSLSARRPFTVAMLGIAATIAAALGTAPEAEAQQRDVVQNMVTTADQLYASPETPAIMREGATISQLYVNIYVFTLDYPAKEQASQFHMLSDAYYLARRYGLENSNEYRTLKTMINQHSDLAYGYHEGMRRHGDPTAHLHESHIEYFYPLKKHAIDGILSAAANFLERVAPIVERRGLDENSYAPYGRFCFETQALGQAANNIRTPSTYNRNLFTAEHRDGSRVQCPLPGQNPRRR